MKNKAILKSAWPYLWKYRRGMALGMGALLVNDLMKAALPARHPQRRRFADERLSPLAGL